MARLPLLLDSRRNRRQLERHLVQRTGVQHIDIGLGDNLSSGKTLAPTGSLHRTEIKKHSAWEKLRKAKQLVPGAPESADSRECPACATSEAVRKHTGHDGRPVQRRRTTASLVTGKRVNERQ